MSLLVQKFGGTSVADSAKILAAARRAIQAHNCGDQVLVVVSARGHTTDELIALAREITEKPPAREMDMLLATGEQVSVALLAMAIQSLGVPAISFTGAQIGLVTDSFHTKARIRNISTERMVQALGEGKIVIVAGFQGVDENYNITTLGRGGSDTTAVALAAVLGATGCEIYTDVDGIYTTDPRIIPEARKIDRISHDEMLELASLGAGVMHSRSIEFAKKYGMPIHVRSSFSDAPGTWIVHELDGRRLGAAVTGTALARDEARITILGVPDRPGVVHAIFRTIAAANIVVNMIVQNVSTGGKTEVSFTVAKGDLAETLLAANTAAAAIGATGVTHDADVAKISVVGLGMRTHTGVATTMFEAIALAGINIQMITTSEIKISVLVDRASAVKALQTAHRAFALDQPGGTDLPFAPSRSRPRAMKLVPLADSDIDTQNGLDPEPVPPEPRRRHGRPGHRRSGAGRVAGPDRALPRARPARLCRCRLSRHCRSGCLRQHDRPERRHRRRFGALVHGAPRRGRPRRPSRQGRGHRRGLGRADPGQAVGHRSRHAHPHGRGNPHVRRFGRARHQYQLDQYERGPDQRRHRHRPRQGRA